MEESRGIRAGVWEKVCDPELIPFVTDKPVRGEHRIDARSQLVVPGFISGHTHAASATPTPMRAGESQRVVMT